MIAVVTGGQHHMVTDAEAELFAKALEVYGVTVLREGGARGVDAWALAFCRTIPAIDVETWLPLWANHGRAAGCIRNVNMLIGPPPADIVLAFPGGSGTAHCVNAARRRIIRVLRIEP